LNVASQQFANRASSFCRRRLLKSKIADSIAGLDTELDDCEQADDEPAELSELSGIGDVDGSPEEWLAGWAI
jgi:hypothetical protein